VVIDADFTVYGTDQTRIAHRFALLVQAANDGGVETILRAQRGREVTLNRTNDNHTGVKIGVLIKQIDLPVDKCAQEVPFAKLNDTFRIGGTGKIATVYRVHNEFLFD